MSNLRDVRSQVCMAGGALTALCYACCPFLSDATAWRIDGGGSTMAPCCAFRPFLHMYAQYIYIYTCIYMCVCTALIFIYMYTLMYMYEPAYIYTYMYVYIYVCVHIYNVYIIYIINTPYLYGLFFGSCRSGIWASARYPIPWPGENHRVFQGFS
jgi:hypothetical protein